MMGLDEESIKEKLEAVSIAADQKNPTRYTLDRFISQGAFGRVWSVHDGLDNRFVAVKEPLDIEDTETISRFDESKNISSKLKTDYVVKIYDAIHIGSSIHLLFMEHCWTTLAEIMRTKKIKNFRFNENEILDIIIKLSEGSQAIHNQGQTHRDIKPSNILFKKKIEDPVNYQDIYPFLTSGVLVPKLGDLGFVKPSHESSIQPRGAVNYRAPEQGIPNQHGKFLAPQKADVYSLGAVLYELLTGKMLFAGYTIGQISQAKEDPQFPEKVNFSGVNSTLADIIKGCLRKDSDSRYSAEELKTALIKFMKKEPFSAIQPLAPYAALENDIKSIQGIVNYIDEYGTSSLENVIYIRDGRKAIKQKAQKYGLSNDKKILSLISDLDKGIESQRQQDFTTMWKFVQPSREISPIQAKQMSINEHGQPFTEKKIAVYRDLIKPEYWNYKADANVNDKLQHNGFWKNLLG